MLYFQASRVINFEKHKGDTKLSTQKISNRITNMKAFKNFSASTPSVLQGSNFSSSPQFNGELIKKNTMEATSVM
jgi:hypothetical protein